MSAEFFVQQQLFTFQLFDAQIITGEKGLALALHDAIQKGFDLRADPGQARSDPRPHVFTIASNALREGVKFLDEALESFGVRRYLCDEVVEVPFEIVAANGFAIAGAAVIISAFCAVIILGLR